ncbi:MAG: Flp family type IVb pilin [Planctomycetaceae bacterium]
MNSLHRFWKSDDATTAVEYAVMLALIVISAIVGIKALSTGSGGMWGNINGDLSTSGFSP